MADDRSDTRTWLELAVGLYDRLTGRGAEITYDFNDLAGAGESILWLPVAGAFRPGSTGRG